MKKRDGKQFSLDLQPPTLPCLKRSTFFSLSDINARSGKEGNVISLNDRLVKKSQDEMTRLYSSIVARARHLFE